MADPYLDEYLFIPNDIIDAVVNEVMKLDGGPIMHNQVRKTMRALIMLGWDGWPV